MTTSGNADRPELAQDELRTRTKILVDLAKRIGETRGDLPASLREITEVAARTLHVDRSSVWLYDDSRRTIACLDLFERQQRQHSSGIVLRASDYPAYFSALEAERAIAADDARSDPRTEEFTTHYLTPLGIHALLDAPIRIRGQMIGVLCNEHCGAPRPWTSLEQNLSATFADFVGLAIEAHEHQEQETKARRLEGQLRHAQKLESLGILAGGVAHDFNNLLVGILGNAGLALMELAADSPVRPLVQDIQAAATRAAELAQEMLAYSGRGALKSEPVDLGALVQEMCHLQRTALGDATIDLDLAPHLPAILGDATQLRRMIINLITNAADAISQRPGGKMKIETRALAAPPKDAGDYIFGERVDVGPHVALTVADDGVGMDAVTRGRIFDPFYTTRTTGRGLGMAVVLGVVGGHKGAILVESELGQGTTITVLLPATTATTSAAVEPPPPSPTRSARGTVLIADDEAIVRTVTRRVLERAGYQVLEAEDGQAALDLFERHRGGLRAVILDLTMPVLSGQEVLARLRALAPDLPILLTSGFSQEALTPDLTRAGRTAFLQKPFNPTSLLATLDGLSRRA